MVDCTCAATDGIAASQYLKSAGILEGMRCGNQVHYSVVDPEAKKIVIALK